MSVSNFRPWLALGLVLAALYVSIPWIETYRHLPSDQVWVPVHDQYHTCGDNTFYAAGMRQVLETPLSFRSPISQTTGTYWVEIFKEGSRWAATILGGFFRDGRIAYVVSFTLGVLLQVGLLFWLSVRVGLRPPLALVCSLLILFWNSAFLPGFGLRSFLHEAVNSPLINDHFRFVATQTAINFLWACMIFCVNFKRWDWRYSLGFFFLGLSLPYSYISISVVGAIFLATTLSIHLYQNRSSRPVLKRTALEILEVLIGLTLIGFWKHIGLFLHSNSQPVVQAHLGDSDPLTYVQHLGVVVRFTVHILGPVLFYLWILRKDTQAASMRRLQTLVAVFCVVFALISLKPSGFHFLSRLFTRGGGDAWVFALIAGALLLAQKWADRLTPKLAPRLLTGLALIALIPVAGLPLLGSVRVAHGLTASQSQWLSQQDWEIFSWLRTHARPGAPVGAPDLTMNQLLPVYTDSNLYFGAPNYSGENPEEEVTKLLTFWRLLQLKDSVLNQWLDQFALTSKTFKCAPDPERLSWAEAEPSLTLLNIFYVPYVKQIFGLTVLTRDQQSLTPEFRLKLEELRSGALDLSHVHDRMDYIVVSRAFEARRKTPNGAVSGYEVVFENSKYRLYRRTS